MKILITGGHPTPALALIDELKKYKEMEIVFVGRKFPIIGEKNYSFEYQEIRKRKIKFIELKTGKLTRFFSKESLINFFLIFIGLFNGLRILIFERPSLVFSFGGYLGLPIAFWAFIFRIPILIHEQTISPGLANRVIGIWAKKVLLAFPQAKIFFNRKKTLVVGNPIRFKDVKRPVNNLLTKKRSLRRPIIYVTGGSLGSHIINLHMEKILPFLLKKYIVIHQIGNISQFNDYLRLKNKFKSSNYFPYTHIEEEKLKEIYQKADLVVSRAGANTFFELLAFTKPTIFIPLSFSASNEQKKHALLFLEVGVGEVFEEGDRSFKLLNLIDKMINNLKKYQDNFKKLRYLNQQNVSQKIAEIIFSYLKKT